MSFALIVSLSIVFLISSTVLFVDGVERIAVKLGLTRFATGALLAAALTALPETIIAILSGFYGEQNLLEVGAGSILAAPSITILLGSPLILLTSRKQFIATGVSRNYLLFAAIFLPSVATLLFLRAAVFRLGLGLGLMGLYAYLARGIYLAEDEMLEGRPRTLLERLLHRDSLGSALVQTLGSLALMIYAAGLLMDVLAAEAEPLTLTLLLTPFGTCLEEVLVASYWALRRKTDIALSLLSGENLIQSTLVLSIGLFATGMWLPPGALFLALIYTAAALLLAFALRRGAKGSIPAAALVLMLYPTYIFTVLEIV